MHYIWETLFKILTHNILVHVYSSPSFVMDIGVNAMMIFVHCLLIVEINNLIRELNVPPLKIRAKYSATEFRVRRPVIRKHPDLGVDIIFKENAVLSNEWDTITKINTILSTSLSEFIHGDNNNNNKRPMVAADDSKGDSIK